MENVRVNGIQLAYERQGTRTPLVLVHGYPLDHTIWNDVVPALENDFDLITPDLRGFGQSEIVADSYKLSDMASDIASLLDHLGIEKAAIAGHSMGGYISLAFARAYPERLIGLGLVASQARGDSPEQKEGRYATADEIMISGVEPIAKAFPPKLTPDVRVQAYAQKLIAQQQPAGLAGALKAMAERDDSRELLPSLKFPVAIVHGQEDALIPAQRAQKIEDALPHATLTILPGVGHMPMMEASQSLASALKALLH